MPRRKHRYVRILTSQFIPFRMHREVYKARSSNDNLR